MTQANIEFSGRIVEIDYETSRFVVRYEGAPPEIGDEVLTVNDAAARCASVLDEKEEARAEVASRKAKGTPDELARLRHWMTVSTFNAGIRRCIAAIRQRAGEVKL